jgi:hypothetical protein
MRLASVRLVIENRPARTATEPVRPHGPDDYTEPHTEGGSIAPATGAAVRRCNNAAANRPKLFRGPDGNLINVYSALAA